jgi:hypothetical protein
VSPGESFQVQYVLENGGDISNFSTPPFHGFRIVSGPNFYSADKSASYQNIVFTLVASREGKFKIHGAVCSIDANLIKSNDAYVKVIAPEPSGESLRFLQPGEDPYEKIRENLFLKLSIDKQTCFIGEPLVATFKLYSRLQSKSDVVKNPGFYGFGVCDMINVNDRVRSEEKLEGHWFDVHTIRKVQLYPLQAGEFTIDAMELSNKVEFSKSMVNKRTEQEVNENMYNKEADDTREAKAEVYEMNIRSEPVFIKVKPLPGKNATDTFTGAVGVFSIKALLDKDIILRNEENALTIEIAGAGNFHTISGPAVKWPKGIEAFEASVTDRLDKQKIPLTGQRRFKHTFLSDKPGKYIIPAVSFSFFNLKTKTYKTVSSKPLTVFVNPKYKERDKVNSQALLKPKSDQSLWLAGLTALILAIVLFVWLKPHQPDERNKVNAKETSIIDGPKLISVEDSLKPAASSIDQGKLFYAELNNSIWSYLSQYFQLSGSQINKRALSKILIAKGIKTTEADELLTIIHECESGIYTNAEINLDKKQLLEKTDRILRGVQSRLS